MATSINASTTGAGAAGFVDAAGGPGVAESVGAAVKQGMQGLNLQSLAAELAAVQQKLDGGARPAGELTNANGAPALAAPAKSFSADDMMALLRNLQTKTQDSQLKTAKENVETNRIEAQKNNEKQLEKIKEWIDKSKEAEKGGLLGKIFGWIGAIVAVLAAAIMVVAAAAVTAVTAGAAGPIMIGLAALAVTGAALMMANQISTSVGGPEISITAGFTKLAALLLKAVGVEPELAEKIGKIVAGVAGLATGAVLIEPGIVGQMAGGIAEVAGADPAVAGYIAMGVGIGASITVGIVMAVATFGAGAVGSATSTASSVTTQTLTGTAKVVQKVGQVAGDAATIAKGAAMATQGAGQIASGVEAIKTAENQQAADKAIAEKKMLEALMIKLQAAMEEDREKLKEVIQAIDQSMTMVSKMINEAADSMSQITTNMSKRAAV